MSIHKAIHNHFIFLKDVFLSNPADSRCSTSLLLSTIGFSFLLEMKSYLTGLLKMVLPNRVPKIILSGIDHDQDSSSLSNL